MFKPRTTFTPDFAATFIGGNAYADNYGYYSIMGGEVTVDVGRTFAAAGTVTVDNITLALPVACLSAGMKSELSELGDVIFWDASATTNGRFKGSVLYSNTNTVRMFRPAASTNGLIVTTTANLPFIWTNNDGLYARFRYPAA